MKRFVVIGLGLVMLLSSCGSGGLSTQGTVMLWETRLDDTLTALASRQPGLKLTRALPGETWSTQMRSGPGPDLIVVEDGWDVRQAFSQGLLADKSVFEKKMTAPTKLLPALARSPVTPALLPSSVYVWGLFYNPTVLKSLGIELPTDWTGWEKSLAALKSAGKSPLSIGTSFGWPGLAWVSVLLLRNNGSEVYLDLLNGKRAFDAPEIVKTLGVLQSWRDHGWIAPSSSTKNWPESLAEVTQGDAGFVLLGAYALNRVTDSDTLAFLPVPQGPAPASELAQILGFAVSAKSSAPEAAWALVDAYLGAGSPGQMQDNYRSSAIADPTQKGFGAVQAELLKKATTVVPTLDKYWPQEKAQAAGLLVQQFLADGSKISASEFASGLQQVSLR